MTVSNTQQQLDRIMTLWLAHHKDNLPTVRYDTAWPSPCYVNQSATQDSETRWQPVRQTEPTDMFERLSAALEVDIHPTIVDLYTRYWSDPLALKAPDGSLSLLQVWNTDDLERLRANLIGHAMAKAQQKRTLSLFFALTEPDDGMLTVNNNDGTVWLEYPGKKPVRQIAESLPEFLGTLTPAT